MHLHSLFRGAHAYLSTDKTLAGLPPDVAFARPAHAAHSIAEIVAHMSFWQHWFLDRCDGNPAPVVPSAAVGWPDVSGRTWDDVRAGFEAGFARALALSDDDNRTGLTVSPVIEFGALAKYTIGDVLIHLALHNAHHLGQVITLRQMQGAWPPPSGSLTW